MPVIVNATEEHPFLPSRTSSAAIEACRAEHQDIRPMNIMVVNLMADKIGTERQLAEWLGDSPIQVSLTFTATDDYLQAIKQGRVPRNTPVEHIEKFYTSWRDVQNQKFDGLIVTGVNALKPDMTHEAMWPEVAAILDWSTTNVLSSVFLCWGGQAALRYFHNIDRVLQPRKTWGVFPHRTDRDSTGLLRGLSDVYSMPVSRWDEIAPEDLAAHPELECASVSEEAGISVIVEPRPYDDGRRRYPYRVYVLGHPEYATDTLANEHRRDFAKDPTTPVPRHYFPGDDPTQPPINTWRSTARLYTRWVEALYEATPFDAHQIPAPCRLRDK